MSEVLKNKSEKNDSDSKAWDSLSEVPFSGENKYTDEERKTIARFEQRLVDDQEDYERALKELKQLEKNRSDGYERAEKFYWMDNYRSWVESDKQALENLREHKPAFEEKEKPDEKEYIPEEALKILDGIPDSPNYTELKRRVKNAYYSVNVQYDEAVKKLSEVIGRRKEYLKGNKRLLDDPGEKDFWFIKRLEMSKSKEFNEKQAGMFLSTAKQCVGRKKEPKGLVDSLYQKDDMWKLEYY